MVRLRLILTTALALACPGVSATQFTELDACPVSEETSYCFWSRASLSPDQQWILYTDETTYAPIYEYFPQVTLQSRTTGSRVSLGVSNMEWARAAAFAPSGHRVVYQAGRFAAPTGLYIQEFSPGSPPVPSPVQQHLVADPGATNPAWSRDGNFIAYESQLNGIWVVPTSGGTPSQVVVAGRSPSWGPGNQLAYEAEADVWIRGELGNLVRLTETTAWELTPAWSPDGEWIAFASNEASQWDIWVISAHGGTRVRVTTDKPGARSPSWTADSKGLVFLMEEGPDTIWLANDLPDFTTSVLNRPWSSVKKLFR